MPTEPVDTRREGNAGRQLGGITGKGFLPGQSGNPAGKKPGTRSVSARLRELLDQPAADGRQVADAVARVILGHALKGDIQFIRELLNRTEGPVTAAPEATTDEATPRIIIAKRTDG